MKSNWTAKSGEEEEDPDVMSSMVRRAENYGTLVEILFAPLA